MGKIIVPIKGMHCRSCELLLEDKLGEIPGVSHVRVSQRKGEALVTVGDAPPSDAALCAVVESAGYRVGRDGRTTWLSRDTRDYRNFALAALILAAFYLIIRAIGLTKIGLPTGVATPALALVVGLVAGVSTCAALVGGLVMALAARHAEVHPEATGWQKFRPHLWFNLGRVAGFAVFGAVLGAAGGFLKLSPGAIAVLMIIVGVVMTLLGLKLVGLSPRLAEWTITLPTSLARLFGSNESTEYRPLTAVVSGALTFFLPCGFTQAMQVAAIGSASPASGALIMSAFALGTAPALLGIGGLTAALKGRATRLFSAVIGLGVLVFGIYNISNGFAAAGFRWPSPTAPTSAQVSAGQPIEDGYQVIRMNETSRGYSPNSFTVKAGVPVRWIVNVNNPYTCAASLAVPVLGRSFDLHAGENVIEFTPPDSGTVPFSCSMGMYRGLINVVP